MPLEEQTWIDPIIDEVVSHALRSGHFRAVNEHEPTTPVEGPFCAVFWQAMRPSRRSSGLNVTSVVLVLNVRIYGKLISEPSDEIDPVIAKAAAYLMNAYNGDFELADNVRNVDIFGAEGDPLEAVAGYIGFNNPSILQRVMTITLPLIVNDVWTQGDG
jgi:hypothetical protein